jgi:transcriptional regulator of acetoin/glycerol metabolism
MVALVRADALPEGFDYPDTGCTFSPSCLACPLPRCRYEPPYLVPVLRTDMRALKAQALHSRGGHIEEIRRALGVSRRTVYRLLTRPAP